MVSVFDQICRLTDGPVKYKRVFKGNLKMVNHANPYSLLEREFEYITRLITEEKLRNGFEVATAFGISALAAALGFKQTDGKLLSMDAYIEEQFNDAGGYQNADPIVYTDTDGWKSAQFLAKKFGVEAHVQFCAGWSPTDTGRMIESVFGDTKLDYAFIDAGHFTEWIWNDFNAIRPYLGNRAFVLFHDVYPETFTPELIARIEASANGKLEVVCPFPMGENMGLIQINEVGI
jgi:predicted O-methyltransferase YrrM